MQDIKLLSSLSLFRELYNKDTDIYDVISEFIKAAIQIESKWSFNSQEIVILLRKNFGFDLPEAVITTTLRNRLCKKEKFLSLSGKEYTCIAKEKKSENVQKKITESNILYASLIGDLEVYVAENSDFEIDGKEKEIILNSLYEFLLDNTVNNKYSNHISAFIVTNKSESFLNILNHVREGFAIYSGVKYSPDINDLGSWKTKLTIFLDTELIFYMAGLNGEVYKNIFDDFYNLVLEVNKAKKLISLKYFKEAESEIENYFGAAEHIVAGSSMLDPTKTAMVTITNGCKYKNEVMEKKLELYSQLERKNIGLEEDTNYYSNQKLNIESNILVTELLAENGMSEDDHQRIDPILKKFMRINSLRNGQPIEYFDESKYILMSGNHLTQKLAFDKRILPNSKAIPFATSIEFVTNRIWFKLAKGLSNDSAASLTSLDVYSAAQVVLSAHLGSSIAEKLEKVSSDFKSGELSKADAEFLNTNFRTQIHLPEEISADIAQDSLLFLDKPDIQAHLRDQDMILKKASDGEKAINELRSIRLKEKEGKTKRFIKHKMFLSFLVDSFLVIFLLALLTAFSFQVFSLFQSDGSLSIIMSIFTVVAAVFSIKKFKLAASYIKALIFPYYFLGEP
jgi:hypothetical protein